LENLHEEWVREFMLEDDELWSDYINIVDEVSKAIATLVRVFYNEYGHRECSVPAEEARDIIYGLFSLFKVKAVRFLNQAVESID
jgi:hypothetical protein